MVQDIELNPTILKSISFFRTQEIHNIAKIKIEAHNISCLESYKKQRDKDLKAERDNWILFRGLRREKELTIAARKFCCDQKIACIIEKCTLNQAWTWLIQYNTKTIALVPPSLASLGPPGDTARERGNRKVKIGAPTRVSQCDPHHISYLPILCKSPPVTPGGSTGVEVYQPLSVNISPILVKVLVGKNQKKPFLKECFQKVYQGNFQCTDG